MSKKNKGFTMVELLAVIVILGILSIISVTAVQGIIAKAKERYYKSQEESFVMAAQSYLNNNKKKQPKVSGQTVKVYLKDLRDAKYIDSIVDYKKEECNVNESYVKVFKYEDDVFYTPYITCPNYTTNLKVYTSDIEITATFTGDDKNLNKAETTIKIVAKNAKDKDGVEDASLPHGIVSYQYKIYQEGKLKYTSDVFDEKKITEVTRTVSLVNYTPGMIKVAVTATNIYGNSLTKTFTKSYRDETPPTCGAITGDSTDWKTGTRTVTIACSDGTGTGCKRDTYTYEFTGDVKVGKIKIEDNAGNSTNCNVNVYIDNYPPVVTLKAYKKKAGEIAPQGSVMNQITNTKTSPNKSLTINGDTVNGWMNKAKWPNGVYLELDYSDISQVSKIEWKWNAVGLQKTNANVNVITQTSQTVTPNNASGKSKEKIENDGYRYGEIIITDQFNHTSTIKVTAPLDRVLPDMPVSGDSTTWINTNRTINIGCTDAVSGCKTSPFSDTISSTLQTKNYSVEDNAGNKVTKTVNTYVDKTKPSCGAIENQSTNWTASDRNISVACSDSHSQCVQAKYSKNFNTSTKVGSIEIKDKAGNTQTCNVNAYVDKTAPSCGSISGQSTTWTNKDRNISVACSDSQSGCTKTSSSHNFTTTQQNGNITIKDNAGNTANCAVNVYIDKNKPTCGNVTGASTTWTKNDRNITVTCNDTGGSGCNAASKNFNTTTKTSTITLKDGAGNTTSCNVNVYVDKTAPSCGSISGQSTTWTKNDRSITVACSDSDSGCGKSSYTTNFNWSIKTGKITLTDNVGNTRDCSVNAYVDKDRPSCGTISGAATSWTNGDRTIKVNCSDGSGSGCTRNQFEKKFTSNAKTGNITISDNAGWTQTCPVNVYIDKSRPSCGAINGASTSWTNGDRRITVACNDDGESGCSGFDKTYNYTKQTDTVTLRDGAGNTGTCNINVYVDKDKPKLEYSIYKVNGSEQWIGAYNSGEWTNQTVKRELKPRDTGGSGINHTEWSSDGWNWNYEGNVERYLYGGDGSNDAYYRTIDNAGNVSDSIHLILRVDKTPPNTWARSYVANTGKCRWSLYEAIDLRYMSSSGSKKFWAAIIIGADDAASGLNEVYFNYWYHSSSPGGCGRRSYNDGAWTPGRWDTAFGCDPTDGHGGTGRYYACDNASNCSGWKDEDVTWWGVQPSWYRNPGTCYD